MLTFFHLTISSAPLNDFIDELLRQRLFDDEYLALHKSVDVSQKKSE